MRFQYFVLALFSLAFASPCDDPQYLEVKAKSIDSLSDTQMTYLLSKDKQCYEYQASLAKDSAEPKTDSISEIESQNKKVGMGVGIFFGVLGFLAICLMPLFIPS